MDSEHLGKSEALDKIDENNNQDLQDDLMITEDNQASRNLQPVAQPDNEESEEEFDNDLALVLHDKKERKEQFNENVEKLDTLNRRKWMTKHGKEHFLNFKDDELKKLKDCFNCLDADGGGTIGLEELENPLIGLGFADSRDDVQKLINVVDKDGNGDIDFDEF